ncbi:hypothetical protein ACPVPU_09555 [Sphingomonas sp. CJ99]
MAKGLIGLRPAMAAPLLLVAACSGGGDEPMASETENSADMGLIDQPPPAPIEGEMPVVPESTPTPPPARAPDAEFTDEEQVLEDAESTGMTSRIDRSAVTPAPVPAPGEGIDPKPMDPTPIDPTPPSTDPAPQE